MSPHVIRVEVRDGTQELLALNLILSLNYFATFVNITYSPFYKVNASDALIRKT